MTNYFRITAYYPEDNFSIIIDSYGFFEKLWQFSSYLIQKGFKILEVSNDEKFLDVNIARAQENKENLILRAIADEEPEYIQHQMNGYTYKAIRIGDKIYIPDKDDYIK